MRINEILAESLDFMEGECPIMAIALHRLTGFPLLALVEHNRGETYLLHAYVGIDNKWRLDAEGLGTVEWYKKQFPYDEIDGELEEVVLTEKELIQIGYTADSTNCPPLSQVLPIAQEVLQGVKDDLEELGTTPRSAVVSESVTPGTRAAGELLKSVITPVYNKNKPIIEKRFNDGQATCTYASKVVSDALTANGIPHKVIEGQFNNDEHWWVAALGFFIDIGDNISDSSVETGDVPMKIVPAHIMSYRPEKAISAEEYAKYYPSIANW